jgi:molecular chaperone GrpE
MSPKDRDLHKPKKGSKAASKAKKKKSAIEDQDGNLRDLMEIYDDDELEEEAPAKLEPIKEKRRPPKSESKKRKGPKEPERRKKPGKPKGKGKGKSKPGKTKKKPTTARKLALTGKAHKLPIEDADDNVDIDWSLEGGDEEESVISDFERDRMDAQMKYYEREKINLMNEVVFLRTDLEQKTNLVDELKNDNVVLRKDFDNYKKRTRGEIRDKLKFASEKLILELLEVMDNFDRTKELDTKTADKEDLLKGFQIIHNQLLDVLKKEGVVAIEAKGEPFDPYIHEAISTVETDDHPHNTVLEDVQKGYEYKHKVLRPSKVRVTQSDIVPAVPVKSRAKKKEKPEKKKKKGGEKKIKKGAKKVAKKELKKEIKKPAEKEGRKTAKKKDLDIEPKYKEKDIEGKPKKKRLHKKEHMHKKKKHGKISRE